MMSRSPSAGLLPSPSAFLVLVGGLLTARALGAVALVIVFGTVATGGCLYFLAAVSALSA
ncbi:MULTISPECIES: hypothetical protein [unclassified Streptomyces]|uniref:hypothetical protein n=1 Tax=unclassified Streptomyces TaxID=2593676 RepID=UPI00081DDCEF|nr:MULTISPECIES: hypothetical protein [unclassified Streptomyces]MYZ36715.1 hypothetical protein [Streptomyces sp. SID4917]SCF85718.1 hypothetical protein GA0115259_1037113 [Streptomyces sp. MnatMP-M17]